MRVSLALCISLRKLRHKRERESLLVKHKATELPTPKHALGRTLGDIEACDHIFKGNARMVR